MIHSFKSMHLSGLGLFTQLCNHHHSQSENIFTHLPKEAVCPPISSHSPFPPPLEPQIFLSVELPIDCVRVESKPVCHFSDSQAWPFSAVPQRGIWDLEYISEVAVTVWIKF